MTATEFQAVIDFEDGLSVDDSCVIRWTNNHCMLAGAATVKKVNAKSILATLDEKVTGPYGTWPQGTTIKAPRLTVSTMNLWSCNNCATPVSGY